MSVISKGITLGYKATSASETYTTLTDLQEIPELGGSKDTIEITTLADSAHTYTNGLNNYGDSLSFKFLYDKTQFATLQALTGSICWQVSLPDASSNNTKCTFTGEPSVTLDGVGVNAVLTYTLKITPDSAMVFA